MRTVPSGSASKLLTVNHNARSEDIGSGKVSTGFPSHSSLVLVGAGTGESTKAEIFGPGSTQTRLLKPFRNTLAPITREGFHSIGYVGSS